MRIHRAKHNAIAAQRFDVALSIKVKARSVRRFHATIDNPNRLRDNRARSGCETGSGKRCTGKRNDRDGMIHRSARYDASTDRASPASYEPPSMTPPTSAAIAPVATFTNATIKISFFMMRFSVALFAIHRIC